MTRGSDREPGPTGSGFDAQLERLQGPLLRYIGRFLGDAERARDVVQEGFLRLWNLHQGGEKLPEAEVAPWLYTVCRRLACDILRKEKRMVPYNEGQSAAAEEEAAEPIGASLPAMQAALARLPANQQEVIRLKFQSGMAYKDIARITGLSVSNVGYLLHVGLKTLRTALAEDAPGSSRSPRPEGVSR